MTLVTSGRSGAIWRAPVSARTAIYPRELILWSIGGFFRMKKLWLASPLLLASLCLAAQTGSSPSSNSATQPSASQSSSQNPNGSATTPSTDQNAQPTTPSTSDQSSTSTSDQNATTSTTSSQSSTNAKKLPQTASPLPLLGLLGLGSLGAGLFRFRKR